MTEKYPVLTKETSIDLLLDIKEKYLPKLKTDVNADPCLADLYHTAIDIAIDAIKDSEVIK